MTHLRFDVEDAIGTVTIDRPPANALNQEVIDELAGILDAVDADPEVRVLVILSGSPKFFMAGGDINGYAVYSPDDLVALVARYRRTFGRLRDLRIPTIVAINGHAQGGGAELVTACDFRIAGPNAKIGFPEIKLGGVASAGGTQFLPKLVRYDIALELLLTGRTVPADEAQRIGLVTRVAEDAAAAAYELARALAAQAPTAVLHTKRCVRATVDDHPVAGATREDEATAAISTTDEFRDNVQAFLTRR